MTTELINERVSHRVSNLGYTLNTIITKLKNVSPYLKVYKGRGDRWNYDPSGLVERVAFYMHFAAIQNTRVEGFSNGVYTESGGDYNHKPALALLEETLHILTTRKFSTLFEVYRVYFKFRESLWKLREEENLAA